MLGKEAGGGMKKGKEIWNEMSWPERKAYAKKHRVYPDSFGPVVTTAFSVTNPEQAVEGYGTGARMAAYKFKPRAVGFWNGLRRHAPHGLPGHEDTVCYDYYEHVNNAMHRAFSKEFARYFTLRFLMTHQVAKYFVDDAPYKYGLMIYTHPAMGAFAKFERGTGKLAGYTSEIRHRTWHLRGFQHVWGSAVALQMMDAYPEMHEEYRKEIAPDAPVVRIVDETPEVDGAADESYGDSIELAGGSVRMVADPRNLCLLLRPPEGKGYTLTLHEFLEPKGNFARVVVDAAGKVTVTNHEEKALLAWSAKGKDGVEVQIPFTIYRPQGLWMNATEHAQCLLEAGEDGAAKTPIYFLSTHKRWTEQLRRIVEQGIANGKYVLDFNDYLPYNYSDLSKPDWHDLSFAAAYGWLLAACAEYRLWQDGRNDWESTKEMKLPIDEARKAILAAADKQEAYARPWELGEGTPSTTVECPASAIKPTIDGVVTEEEWKDAGRTQGMYALPSMYSTATIGSQEVGVADAAYQGIVLLKRDDENLYLAFGCGEPHPEGLSFDETLRQGPLWNDDRVEIFLDTDHDQKSYMHLIINGVGTYYTALGTGWDWTADAQIATKIANRAWYMEVAIPLKALDGVPESGAKWGANFTIYRTQRLQNFTWSPLRAAWLHAPKQFGTIVFP
jgi:hypothetical protein